MATATIGCIPPTWCVTSEPSGRSVSPCQMEKAARKCPIPTGFSEEVICTIRRQQPTCLPFMSLYGSAIMQNLLPSSLPLLSGACPSFLASREATSMGEHCVLLRLLSEIVRGLVAPPLPTSPSRMWSTACWWCVRVSSDPPACVDVLMILPPPAPSYFFSRTHL